MSETPLGSGASPTRGKSWRVLVDRAWRTPNLRRTFESENDLEPLAEAGDLKRFQAASGYAGAYERRFLIWATLRLGLEGDAPSDIRHKIAARG